MFLFFYIWNFEYFSKLQQSLKRVSSKNFRLIERILFQQPCIYVWVTSAISHNNIEWKILKHTQLHRENTSIEFNGNGGKKLQSIELYAIFLIKINWIWKVTQ